MPEPEAPEWVGGLFAAGVAAFVVVFVLDSLSLPVLHYAAVLAGFAIFGWFLKTDA